MGLDLKCNDLLITVGSYSYVHFLRKNLIYASILKQLDVVIKNYDKRQYEILLKLCSFFNINYVSNLEKLYNDYMSHYCENNYSLNFIFSTRIINYSALNVKELDIYTGLLKFCNHSDCDGELTYEDSKYILEWLKHIKFYMKKTFFGIDGEGMIADECDIEDFYLWDIFDYSVQTKSKIYFQ